VRQLVSPRFVEALLSVARPGAAERATPQAGAPARAPLGLSDYLDLWETTLARPQRPALSLRAAESMGRDASAALRLACSVCATLGDVMRQQLRLHQLGPSVLAWTSEPRGPRAAFRLAHEGEPGRGREASIELALADCFLGVRSAAAPALQPVEIRLPHAPRGAQKEHESFFGCRVVWEAEHAELVLSTSALSTPCTSADPRAVAALERSAAAAADGRPLPDVLRDHIAAAMLSGSPSVTVAARSLAVSPRTLRRVLSERATSFQRLLDEARLAQAAAYLADARLTLPDIAFLLGYPSVDPLARLLGSGRPREVGEP
jgi:AraC-like DNA-binding protein